MRKSNFSLKYFYLLVCCFAAILNPIQAQIPRLYFGKGAVDSSFYMKLESNKIIPEGIKTQALIALSYYPELKKVKIIFRVLEKKIPLTTRPDLLSLFKRREKRAYIITISSKSDKQLTPILFFKLPYNAQIGVLGHELAHVSDFNTKSTLELISLFFKMLSSGFVDSFEFNTDLICINHGLGYKLLDWSKYVRKVLNIDNWGGASNKNSLVKNGSKKQRYMNPETIEKYIASNPDYQNIK
jgi:hypothetical protein